MIVLNEVTVQYHPDNFKAKTIYSSLKIDYSDIGEGADSHAIQNGNGLKIMENRIFFFKW